MTSNASSRRLDLERDLPTTPEDVAVLRRLRHSAAPPDLESYFAFLMSFPPPTADELRRRRGPRGDPFEL